MTTEINVQMRADTLKKMDRLKARVHTPSRSDAIRRAVEISDLLVDAVGHGDRIIIESKSGKQRQILITGLNT